MSDQTSTIKELRDLVNKFREERKWSKAAPAMFAKDLVVEAAELLDHFVWDEGAYLKSPEIARAVKYELVDVLYAVLMLSQALEIDLTQTLREKLKILTKKYPALQCRKHQGDAAWVFWQRKKFKSKE